MSSIFSALNDFSSKNASAVAGFALVSRSGEFAFANSLLTSEGHHYDGEIENGYWIDAANLKPGYRLLNADETFAEVTQVRIANAPLKAYNISVEDFETFFVTAKPGDEPVWVHNNCEKKRGKNRIPDTGAPNTVATNSPGTTKKLYDSNGNVTKEWNKGHGPNAPRAERNDHIHDYKPIPQNPTGRGERMGARPPRMRDLFDLGFF